MKHITVFYLLIFASVDCTDIIDEFDYGDRKITGWPMDCQNTNIDLILVTDTQVSSSDYRKQTIFFSQLVDVFSPASENTLKRLRVSLVASTMNSTTGFPFIDVRIKLGSFDEKKDLRKAIKDEDQTTGSSPSSAIHALLQTVFNGSNVSTRQDAVVAVVMIIQDEELLDSTDLNPEWLVTLDNETNTKLFLVVIAADAENTFTDVFSFKNYIYVNSLRKTSYKQQITMSLCNLCHSGWLTMIKSETTRSNKRISCYKLNAHSDLLNWNNANQLCKRQTSELASIETRDELNLLRTILTNEIVVDPKTFPFNLGFSVPIFIGLRRRSSSLGQRFRWLSDMPLSYSHWEKNQPEGGNTIGCVVWSFEAKADQKTNSSNPEFSNLQLDDGWYSVGCGSDFSFFYLCEPKDDKGLRQHYKETVFGLSKPNFKSTLAAIHRGELAYMQGSKSLFSVSVLLSLQDTVLSASFAVFNGTNVEPVRLDSISVFWCDNFTHIPYTVVCDSNINCANRRDEMECYDHKCDMLDEFRCSNGQCIPTEAKCDLYKDCTDGSDELDCIMCSHGFCPNARCMPKHWLGDGEIDCNACTCDGSLAFEALSIRDDDLSQCAFTCNRTECVSITMLNNGIVDCHGPEGPIDETYGMLDPAICYFTLPGLEMNYTSWAPRCVYIKDRYGELLGCRDMTHLENCENFECPEGYFKCPHSYCIPVHYLKNSEYDCTHGEDEGEFTLECEGYFRCSWSDICLHPDHVCDNQVHCPRGDDEFNCQMTCRDGFLCVGNTVKVNGYNKAMPLTDISFIDSKTRFLDLSGIDASQVFPRYPKGPLFRVASLNLSGCSIRTVDRPSVDFYARDLRALWQVDLSFNRLEIVPNKSIFRSMFKLQFLNLSHNENLTYLQNNCFKPYSNSLLRVLDLSYTGLTSIRPAVLVLLTQLEILNLRNTHIITIPPDMFPWQFHLQVLDLRGLVLNDLYPKMFKNVTIHSRLLTDSFKVCCPQIHNDNTKPNVCVTSKDPFSSCSDLMSDMLLRIFLWLNGFVAIAGNLVVIVYRLFIDRAFFKLPYGHFVMHLGFADLLMGTYMIIIAAADTYYRDTYVWDEYRWRKSIVCEVAGFLSTLSSETSTFFIALITLDRFLVVKFPFGQMKLGCGATTVCCCLAWTVGFVIALIPMLPTFADWELYSTNGMCLGLPLISDRRPGWVFATAIFIFFNFFLFVLIAFGQVAIYRSISASRIGQDMLSNSAPRRTQDQTVAKNLSMVVITDFLCWFPVCVMGLLALAGYEIGLAAYAWSAVLILPVNSAINPLLYTIPIVINSLRQCKKSVCTAVTKSQ